MSQCVQHVQFNNINVNHKGENKLLLHDLIQYVELSQFILLFFMKVVKERVITTCLSLVETDEYCLC